MRVFISPFLFLTIVCSTRAQDYNIISLGALPDGKTLNTRAIQSAIDAANKNGGGRVIIPEGIFLTGTIILKSNVELNLTENAMLLGSTNPDHYLKLNRWKALIMADGQSNISITGEGKIDAQGTSLALNINSLFYAGKMDSINYDFVHSRPKEPMRPQIIEFVNCKNVLVKNVTLLNAACWVQTYEKCTLVILDSINVYSDSYWNNDGVDIVDCRQVRITNCNINSADDGICLKSQYADFRCDSIYVGNCSIRSSASAIKFGTVSHGGFRNVTIMHIKVYDTYRSTIAIECVDGGVIENILVDDVIAVNTGNAIFLRLGDRNAKREAGVIKNITLKNIKVEVPSGRPDSSYIMQGPALTFLHNIFPSSISGIPNHPIQNVILENIYITYPGTGDSTLAYLPLSRIDSVPEKEKDYPEFSMFGELPAWGLYARHVDGLTMRNVYLGSAKQDYRYAVVFDDVKNLEMKEMVIEGDNKIANFIFHRTDNTPYLNDNSVLKW